MIVGTCQIQLNLPGATNLKEKRKIVQSIKQKIRNTYKVSVAEIAKQDQWQLAIIGIGAVGSDPNTIDSLLKKIINFIGSLQGDFSLINHDIELLRTRISL